MFTNLKIIALEGLGCKEIAAVERLDLAIEIVSLWHKRSEEENIKVDPEIVYWALRVYRECQQYNPEVLLNPRVIQNWYALLYPPIDPLPPHSKPPQGVFFLSNFH